MTLKRRSWSPGAWTASVAMARRIRPDGTATTWYSRARATWVVRRCRAATRSRERERISSVTWAKYRTQAETGRRPTRKPASGKGSLEQRIDVGVGVERNQIVGPLAHPDE